MASARTHTYALTRQWFKSSILLLISAILKHIVPTLERYAYKNVDFTLLLSINYHELEGAIVSGVKFIFSSPHWDRQQLLYAHTPLLANGDLSLIIVLFRSLILHIFII